jgi:hypothetical protein
MEKILVYDNFFTDIEISNIQKIISSRNWEWGHTSVSNAIGASIFWCMHLSDEEYFNDYLKQIFEKHFAKKFKLLRVYANGQTFGQDGTFHTDSNESNHYTVCLYLTKIEKELVDSAGGYITFKVADEKYNLSYEPLYNRIIMFPSNYWHKASSFSRFFTDIRICVSWKLVEMI